MRVVECEQSNVKQETAPTAVKTETEEEEESASAFSVPRGASAAGNEEASDEQNVEAHQSESRETTAMTSAVTEEYNEEELNVEEPSAGGNANDDLVQPANDGTGDDGHASLVVAATTTEIPTSEVVGGKKRSQNVRAETRSKKRAKLTHSTVHETSEESCTTSQPRVVRRSLRRATTKALEETFEGTSRGIEAEEETDDDVMPAVEEDGPPVDDGDDDHDEDDERIIVAERVQQVRPANKSFDERVKALMGFKEKFGHCDVPRKKSGTKGEYQSLGKWCDSMRMAYKKIQKGETLKRKLTQENMQQLEDAGFKWSLSATPKTFYEWFAELMTYKKNEGHCNVPRSKSGEYQSLGRWCHNVRSAYKKIQKRETPPRIKITEENIRQLEDAGFKWSHTVQSQRTVAL